MTHDCWLFNSILTQEIKLSPNPIFLILQVWTWNIQLLVLMFYIFLFILIYCQYMYVLIVNMSHFWIKKVLEWISFTHLHHVLKFNWERKLWENQMGPLLIVMEERCYIFQMTWKNLVVIFYFLFLYMEYLEFIKNPLNLKHTWQNLQSSSYLSDISPLCNLLFITQYTFFHILLLNSILVIWLT